MFPEEILRNLSYEKREQSWLQVFNNSATDNNFTYVAEERSGQIVGFANGGIEREGVLGYQGELYAIYILKRYQKKG
ncbi:MAG: GNAT family N-acetyltransferase [Cyanobacteria bacterium P01_E01_bin.35]